MKKLKYSIIIALVAIISMFTLYGCTSNSASKKDQQSQLAAGNKLAANQPTPTDIEYSLERYNIIRRMYWINGQREKARTLPCPIVKPLGYIYLMLEDVGIVQEFTVDGKVTSLNNFMTPISEYYEGHGGTGNYYNDWLPDVDGCYGYNVEGIFFFTIEGNYVEWTGIYIYTDIPFKVENPVLEIKEV